MKHFMIATTLLALSSTSFGATTGTLLLQGVVTQKISVIVTPTAIASTLDLGTSQTDLSVATVNEISNSKTGYKMTITSANLGKLKRTEGTDVFPYTLKYNGSAVSLATTSGTTFTNSTTSAVNVNRNVSISYNGASAESVAEGTYADTVTFSIAAN